MLLLSSLSSVYSDLAQKSILLGDGWPDSASFCKLLHRETMDNGKPITYSVPSFSEHGPVVLVTFLRDEIEEESDTTKTEPSSVCRWLQPCLAVFDQFCMQELSDTDTCQWIPALVPHLCITVFQEHPSFLHNDEQRKNWREIDTSIVNRLVHALDTAMLDDADGGSCSSAIPLRLDSLLFTPDGALIAGCIEDREGEDTNPTTPSPMQRLRRVCTEIAVGVLGGTTSRPKSLLHVTLGRVLSVSVPEYGTGGGEVSLIERYNRRVLPELVQRLRNEQRDRWSVTYVTLVRNTKWLCEENEVYWTKQLLERRRKRNIHA